MINSNVLQNTSNPVIWQSQQNNYQTELTQCIEIQIPYTPLKLLAFPPKQYPYLWFKYSEGLQKCYEQMQVAHIIPSTLKDPSYNQLAFLVFDKTECIAGMRVNGPLRKAEHAAALEEMSQDNINHLKNYLNTWLPEGIIEPKGVWVDNNHPSRSQLAHIITRTFIYSAALLQCRYCITTSPQNMTRIYSKLLNINIPDDIEPASYPSDAFVTRFGYIDLHNVLDTCAKEQIALINREWSLLIHAKQRLTESGTQAPHKASILDSSNPFHQDEIHNLQQEPHYQIKEPYEALQQELSNLKPPVSAEYLSESMRWVIYPWSRKATQMLGPRSFQRLRLDRNRNKLTQEEQQQLQKLSIGIVGLSTGHVIAHTLAMEGLCGYLRLADFDLMELSNLNRIPDSILNIGENKALSTARHIAELDPYLPIDVFTEGVSEEMLNQFISGLDIIIEECDSLDVKLLIREIASREGIPVMMATSDRGLLDIERFDLEPERKPFHGLVQIGAKALKDLSRSDKAGYALSILEGGEISARLAASMIEIDKSLHTWPQLASDVTQGAAMVATAVRLLGTKQPLDSLRIRCDMEKDLQQARFPENRVTDIVKQARIHPSPTPPQYSGDIHADMLLAAQYAPSPGNIQPWKIAWQGNTLNFHLDPQRTTFMDIHHRGAFTAIGAAIFNAQIAASHYQKLGATHYFPDQNNPEWVAQLHLGNDSDEELNSLFPDLLKRNTNRHIGIRTPFPESIQQQLKKAVNRYPVKLHWLSTEADLDHYSDIAIESDRLRNLISHLNKEMHKELVWPGKDCLSTGIDVRTMELPHQDLYKLQVARRLDVMQYLAQWDSGKALGDYTRDRLQQTSALLVMTIDGTQDLDYVIGGQAVQRFWIMAEALGFAVQPISPIFIYAHNEADIEHLTQGVYKTTTLALQQRFKELLQISASEHPVLVVRLTKAPPPSIRSQRETLRKP